MSEPPEKPDHTAKVALALCILPLSSIIIGFLATRNAEGWEAAGRYFWTLVITGLLSLMPIVPAIAALVGRVPHEDKVLMAVPAILIPIALFFLFLVFGNPF